MTRVERVRAAQIEYLGGRRTMQYGGVSLPLVALHDVAAVDDLVETQQWVVVVFDCAGQTWDCWRPSRWTWWRPAW